MSSSINLELELRERAQTLYAEAGALEAAADILELLRDRESTNEIERLKDNVKKWLKE